MSFRLVDDQDHEKIRDAFFAAGGRLIVAIDDDVLQQIAEAGLDRPLEAAVDDVEVVGDGALQFALANGFKKSKLLTARSEQAWKEWLKTSEYKPVINIENHDTIGILALDDSGNLSGACTTSGMAYKMHGRVGDSPIIGAGLYVDNEVGAATATGVGEEVIRIVGSHCASTAVMLSAHQSIGVPQPLRMFGTEEQKQNSRAGARQGI